MEALRRDRRGVATGGGQVTVGHRRAKVFEIGLGAPFEGEEGHEHAESEGEVLQGRLGGRLQCKRTSVD